MKCKHCNGTGKVRGYFYEKTGVNKWEKVWGDSPCDECNGTGEVNTTNEEWFCSLPTKEKAEWLEEKMTWAAQEQGTFTAKGWEMWLKEKHWESE